MIGLGRSDPSAGEYIAEIQRRLAAQDKVGYRLHAMGTSLEGATEDILAVVGELHRVPVRAWPAPRLHRPQAGRAPRPRADPRRQGAVGGGAAGRGLNGGSPGAPLPPIRHRRCRGWDSNPHRPQGGPRILSPLRQPIAPPRRLPRIVARARARRVWVARPTEKLVDVRRVSNVAVKAAGTQQDRRYGVRRAEREHPVPRSPIPRGSLRTYTRAEARAFRPALAAAQVPGRRRPRHPDPARPSARLRAARRALPVATAGLLPPDAGLHRGRRGRAPGGLRRRLQRDGRRRARRSRSVPGSTGSPATAASTTFASRPRTARTRWTTSPTCTA